MAKEILCPACGHSLAFHPYDDSDDGCQAPLGGLNSGTKCGCSVTIHIFIQDLIKKDCRDEVEKLHKEKKVLKESAEFLFEKNNQMKATTDILENKLKRIADLAQEGKLIEPIPVYVLFTADYKRKIHEILDKVLTETPVETEKNDG